MTEKSLQTLLEKLNSGKTKSMLIFARPLNQYVDFAKIWMQKPKISDNVTTSDGPDHFYLIKNDEGIFIALVYDMLRDLHWYVLPAYRKQGYLTKFMKTVIIPHLFLERDQQKITIDEMQIGTVNFEASQKVALNLGFKKSEENEYILLKENTVNKNSCEGKNSELTAERVDELRKHINFLARSLWTIQTEIEMSYGNTEYCDSLKELVWQIKSQTWKLEDYWWYQNCEGTKY